MNIVLYVIVAIVVLLIFKSLFVIEQQNSCVIERFCKFVRIGMSCLNFKIPLIEKVRGILSLRIQQLDIPVETKTQDNVFVKVGVSVQYCVLQDKTYEAFYKLENPGQQITSFIFDVVRAQVPKMRLDDVFERKDDIAVAIQQELSDVMSNFGYQIVKALVTDIDPDSKVKTAMNEINEAQRLRVAANERGEAEKILKVKQAEGDAESKALQGKGIANQRKAIVEGLKESVGDFQKSVKDVSASEVMSLVLIILAGSILLLKRDKSNAL